MKKKGSSGPRIVYSGTMWEAGMVKSLLENAEIRTFFNNEIIGSNQGGIPVPFPGGNVSVVVAEEDFDLAMQVVNDYLATRKN
jgi:hypothetical protein